MALGCEVVGVVGVGIDYQGRSVTVFICSFGARVVIASGTFFLVCALILCPTLPLVFSAYIPGDGSPTYSASVGHLVFASA